MGEYITRGFVVVFALGWIDFGQGAQYTWWNLLTLGG